MRSGDGSLLKTIAALRDEGWTEPQRRRALRTGEHLRVRDGVVAPAAAWAALRPEQRIVERARAFVLVSETEPIWSHTTAAAIHGLPVIRAGDRLHLLSDDTRTGALHGISRRRSGTAEPEVVEIDGLRCTSLDLTATEIGRWERPETAVAALDAALARVVSARAAAISAEDAAESAREHWIELATRRTYRLGVARRALAFADPAAERPGESVSRLYLRRLGFAPPRLQAPVPAPHGGHYFLDFALDDADAFGEFDGELKYRDPAFTNGRSIERIMLDEKRREDWIRGTTQRRFARWGWEHLADATTLGRRLAAFSIHPGRRPLGASTRRSP